MNKEAMATYKKIILYFIHHLDLTPTNAQITDFLLTKKYVGYFNAQQALSELTQDGYLRKSSTHNKSFYEITQEGISILNYSPADPSKAIKEETLSYIKEQYGNLRIDISMPADYSRQPDGSYMAVLSLTHDENTVFSVSMGCPDEKTAEKLCLDWNRKCPDTYALLLEKLFTDENDDIKNKENKNFEKDRNSNMQL